MNFFILVCGKFNLHSDFYLWIFFVLFLNLFSVFSQNKILHSRLEALHIQLAEKDRLSSGLSSGTAGSDSSGDAGFQNVINYLRRSREIVSFLAYGCVSC